MGPAFPGFGDSYGFSPYGGDEAFGYLAMLFGGIYIIFVLGGLLLSITSYILRSIGLYSIGEKRGMSGNGLAWIPFVGLYRASSILDDINARNGSRTRYGALTLSGFCIGIVAVIIYIAGFISIALTGSFDRGAGASLVVVIICFMLGVFVSMAASVIYYISLYEIFKHYRQKSAVLWTVLSVMLSFMPGFFLFALRNAEPSAPDQSEYYSHGNNAGYGYRRPQEWPEPPRAPEPQGWRQDPPPEPQPWDDSAPR